MGVVIIVNMKARLHTHKKINLSDNEMIEMRIWSVASPVEPSQHLFKYGLVYIRDGKRVVGFDNERGKGDHCHLDGVEYPYKFVRPDQLIEDFIVEVDKRRVR